MKFISKGKVLKTYKLTKKTNWQETIKEQRKKQKKKKSGTKNYSRPWIHCSNCTFSLAFTLCNSKSISFWKRSLAFPIVGWIPLKIRSFLADQIGQQIKITATRKNWDCILSLKNSVTSGKSSLKGMSMWIKLIKLYGNITCSIYLVHKWQ